MTLSEMAAQVCLKIGRNDEDSLAACKKFLTTRGKTIWADQLWKDSVVQVTKAIDPATDTLLANTGIVLMPAIVDKLIALRSTENYLENGKAEQYYRSTPDIFAQQGTPMEYFELCPVVTQIRTNQLWAALGLNGSTEIGTTVRVSYINGTTGSIVNSNLTVVNAATWATLVAEGSTAGNAVYGSIITDFTSPTKPSQFQVSINGLLDDGSLDSGIIAVGSFSSLTKNRIRLVKIPTVATTLSILCKRAMPEFNQDSSEAPLRGLDEVLMAFAQGDMLQYGDKAYDMAGIMYQEAGALLEQYKRVQVTQRAHNAALVPDSEPWYPHHYTPFAYRKNPI